MRGWRPDHEGKSPKTVKEFSGWNDFLDYVKDPSATPGYNSSEENDKNFSGTSSYREAQKVALEGWNDGTIKAKNLTDAMVNKIVNLIDVPTLVYDVEGINFDIDLVNRGEHECWYSFETKTETGEGEELITIVVNMNASTGINKDSIIRRGAVIAAATELLEYAGKKVTVIAHNGFNNEIYFRIPIKAAKMPLDMSRLILAVAHPSMLRRLLFRALELNPAEMEACGLGYGIPGNPAKEYQGDIYFPAMLYDTDYEAYNEPEKFILNLLKTHGVDIREEN